MRSTSKKYNLPTALDEAVSQRWAEAGYDNQAEYVMGLIRYDLLTRKPHSLTTGVSKLSRSEQDKLDDGIAKAFATGETVNGSWFERVVKEAVEATGTQEPEESRLTRELLNRLVK